MNLRSRLVLAGIALIVAWAGFTLFRPQHVTNAPPDDGPFVAFGDSLTEGVGAPPEGAYPAQLSSLIGVPIINRGVRGETAAEALRRLDASVLRLDPALVIVCLGGNDILQRRDVDGTFAALDEIVGRLVESGAMVVLLGVEGLPLISDDFGSRYQELANRYGCLYIPDILGGIIGRGELMSDNVHPNQAGYARMAGRIADELEPYLSE